MCERRVIVRTVCAIMCYLGTQGGLLAFPRAWTDADGDCQDSRQEALIEQATGPLKYDRRGCRVIAGRWISPYTGAVLHDPSKIDIDHVVPLKWAWTHGGARWPYERWMAFVNDPVNLLSVEASLNRQKGAKGLDRWLPPRNACQYVSRFLRIVRIYRLDMSSGEVQRYRLIRAKHCAR